MTDVAIDPALDAAYVVDQRRPHWPATIAGFEAASAAGAADPRFVGDVGFGPHPRQRFDWFPADGAARGIVAWFHPGFWQMRDRTLFRCLMPRFAALGLDVAMVGYPLCPEVTLAELTEAARAVVPALVARETAVHGRPLPIVAAGHSAGAHLAVELALTDWPARGLAPAPIAAVLALSGVYDLEPLIPTSLQAALRLDPASARAASPVHRVGSVGAPALFAVGGAETAAFLEQNHRMAAAWRAAGHEADMLVSPDDDHFSLIRRFDDPASTLVAAIRAVLDRALPPVG